MVDNKLVWLNKNFISFIDLEEQKTEKPKRIYEHDFQIKRFSIAEVRDNLNSEKVSINEISEHSVLRQKRFFKDSGEDDGTVSLMQLTIGNNLIVYNLDK